MRLWFTPTVGQVDSKEARKDILGAKQAILFLMFNPGPKDTLLNAIIERARAGTAGKRLYIHGAINQDPSTTKNPVELFDRGQLGEGRLRGRASRRDRRADKSFCTRS